MPSVPVLHTRRLMLRPPTEADRGLWVRLHRDPRTYQHAPHAMAATDDDASAQFDKVQRHWAERGFGYQVVERDGIPVGVGGVKRNDEPELNLYYRFSPEVHGQGLAREAARSWVAWAIEHRPHLPVVAVAAPHNRASVATAISAGLTEAGEHHQPGDPVAFRPSVILRTPSVTVTRTLDDTTREQVLDLWCATNDSGGAVGFIPGAPRGEVSAALSQHEASMTEGLTSAVLLRSAPDAALVAFGLWQRNPASVVAHRRHAHRVMTDPARRGRNLGRLLLAAMARAARADGGTLGVLDVRGGTGLERFYERCGWAEYGRLPGGVRLSGDDVRDSILMYREF